MCCSPPAGRSLMSLLTSAGACLSVCLAVSVFIRYLDFSGTKLDANARAAIKNAVLLLRGKEAKLAKAREARETREVSHGLLLKRTAAYQQPIASLPIQIPDPFFFGPHAPACFVAVHSFHSSLELSETI